ncbi:MAG TPA: hypothetical protein VFA81_06295 [Burkholderiales bacterium]|nr:hypothetical protein [Burkholderiales bacterium]
MPRGASPKREREYEELKEEFKSEGRYKGREEEVAARIVNKQRRQFGETKAAQARAKAGKAPERGVPLHEYQHLTVDEIVERLDDLSYGELRKLEQYERQHKNRKTLLSRLERKLHH